MSEAPFELIGVTKTYCRGSHHVRALDNVWLRVEAGEAVGIVGESGSGKSTVVRHVLGLSEPTSGTVHLFGKNLAAESKEGRRQIRERMGVVFQEPHDQLDPQWSVQRIVAEPLRVHKGISFNDAREVVAERLNDVSLQSELLERRPSTLSGGQAQRVAVARALILKPDLLLLDEPTASLDMTTRAQTLRLFAKLRNEFNLALVFVSHDLGSVRAVTDRVIVMLNGRVVEAGPTEEVLSRPRHPYTKLLLDSELSIDTGSAIPDAVSTAGRTANLGLCAPEDATLSDDSTCVKECAFTSRCPFVIDACYGMVPVVNVGPHHESLCIRATASTKTEANAQ